MKPSSRRNFISDATKAGIGSIIAMPTLAAMFSFKNKNTLAPTVPLAFKTGFDQTPLPYAFNALEPNIDAETMQIHYTKHAAAYCKNLKDAILAEKISATTVEDILAKVSCYSTKVRNNAGGHYNHELFWKLLSPTPTQVGDKLTAIILRDFGSLENLKKQFNEAAKSRFGSGWAWVIVNADGKLLVTSTANQDNTMMDIAEVKGFPLFGLDVWEHAYYLKYRNVRADYIDNFWKVLDWNYVNERFILKG